MEVEWLTEGANAASIIEETPASGDCRRWKKLRTLKANWERHEGTSRSMLVWTTPGSTGLVYKSFLTTIVSWELSWKYYSTFLWVLRVSCGEIIICRVHTVQIIVHKWVLCTCCGEIIICRIRTVRLCTRVSTQQLCICTQHVHNNSDHLNSTLIISRVYGS